ncbi:MAG: peptide ABC transporter substrate-binding protein [Candidatus Methylacidiphilales bacterium]
MTFRLRGLVPPGTFPNDVLRFFAPVSACALLCLAFLGCAKRPADVDFIFVNGPEPKSLDPAVITGQADGRISSSLFEGLTARDAAGEIIPGMAERWDVSENGTRYTFYLREAQWSNGDPVTAHDFVGSWRRILEPATAAPYSDILFFLKNAEAYQKGQISDFSEVGVRALDDRTLQVDLEAPTAYFPELTAFVTYQPVHLPTVKSYGEAWVRPEHIVVNGPYRLRAWKINDRIELERNETYWNAQAVAFRRVDAMAVAKATTALNLFLTGQADLILDKSMVPAQLIAELRGLPEFHSYTFLANYFYRFNVTRPPLDNVLVRRALSAAIDRQRIVDRITKAGELPATALTPLGIGGYIPPEGIGFDPDQARKWLAEAGFPGGAGFPRLSILYNKTDLNEQVAVEIQSMWAEILGIRVDLRNQEWATYLTSLDQLDYDIARSSWVGDYKDPNTFLDCFVTGRGNNRTGWSNSTYDALLARANQTLDAATRWDLMRQAETILVRDDAPIAPIYYFTGIMLFDANRLGGVQGNLIDDHPIRAMYWKEGKRP